MSNLVWLAEYFSDASHHWLLSAGAGLLGSLPIWITLFVYWLVRVCGTRRRMSTAAVYGIIFMALLVGSLWALAVHGWADGFSVWYSTPLGTGLKIDTGGVKY